MNDDYDFLDLSKETLNFRLDVFREELVALRNYAEDQVANQKLLQHIEVVLAEFDMWFKKELDNGNK